MKNERRTNSIIKRVLNVIITLILVLLQVALYVLFFTSINEVKYINVTFRILSLLGVIYLYQSKYNSSYKYSWAILMTLFPLFGVFLFFIVGLNRRLPEKKIKKVNQYISKYTEEEEHLDECFSNDLIGKKHASILISQANLKVYKNTDFKFYSDPVYKTKDLIEDIKKAKQYIFMEYFILAEGKLFSELEEILIQKASGGVEVKILYDDIGSITRLSKDRINFLKKQSNIEIIAYNPMGAKLSLGINYRDHRKMTIIDGNVVYSGGDNIADEYVHIKQRHGFWRDTSFRLIGEAVKGYVLMFVEMWYLSSKKMLDASKYMRCRSDIKNEAIHIPFGDGPMNNVDLASDIILSLVNNAKKNIYISTPYLIVNQEIIDALANASASGVDVRILVPCIPDKKVVFWMTQAHYRKILEKGGKIYEYTPGFNHAKEIVVDGEYAMLGTINLDYRSLYLHFECADLIMYDQEIKKIEEDFIKNINESKIITYENWKKRSFIKKVIQYFLYIFSSLF